MTDTVAHLQGMLRWHVRVQSSSTLKHFICLCPSPCPEQVQFIFGGTEFSVNCVRKATGEKVADVALSLVQEVEDVA